MVDAAAATIQDDQRDCCWVHMKWALYARTLQEVPGRVRRHYRVPKEETSMFESNLWSSKKWSWENLIAHATTIAIDKLVDVRNNLSCTISLENEEPSVVFV